MDISKQIQRERSLYSGGFPLQFSVLKQRMDKMNSKIVLAIKRKIIDAWLYFPEGIIVPLLTFLNIKPVANAASNTSHGGYPVPGAALALR